MKQFKPVEKTDPVAQDSLHGWWSRPTALLSATAFGFVLFQALRLFEACVRSGYLMSGGGVR